MRKRINFLWITAFLLCLALAVLSAGCGNKEAATTGDSKEQGDVFKVGVLTSLSGAEVYGGNITKRGYDTWADTVNQKGGIKVGDKQYKVQMFYADDQSDPASGADAVERMITKDKVDFILGPYTSGVTLAAAPICEKYKVPMITGSAESPMIWQQKFKYTFGTIPAVNLTASYPVNTLVSDIPGGAKTMAILAVNDAFSKAVAESFKATAEKLGVKVVKYDIVPAGTDFTPLLGAIKGLNPDVVAVGGHEKEHMEVIKSAKSLGFLPKAFLMHYGVTNPDFVKNLGKDAEAVYGASTWTSDLDIADALFESSKKFVETYKTKWGDEPDYTATGCTVAGEVFGAALEKLGAKPPLSESDREAMVTVLEDIKVDTLYGATSFAKEGDNYHNNTGLEGLTIQIQGGAVKIVGPKDKKLAEPIYPAPAWDKR
ncbi:branched-chain amino acid transporter substrate-binding protein [Desulfocucumis palustris]|uniref:Branched-chain amino acid transporter substrate-binding protein n=1 Tax=Desulfocucumis palustris TaxID=1898651 RepID=A0A2L2XLV2_9FIRM|nr:amino acid ABC transporter substrate-binding protein [Desulfocucumis palustris]GBF35286.1 branched-chain amino acid transporter substrate-binding protein [Desulfocucumis palustris]